MIRDFLLSRAAAGGDKISKSREWCDHPKQLTVTSQLEDFGRQVLEDGSEVD